MSVPEIVSAIVVLLNVGWGEWAGRDGGGGRNESIPVSSTILNVPYKLDSPMSHEIKSEPPGVFTHSRSFNLEYAPQSFCTTAFADLIRSMRFVTPNPSDSTILNPESQAQAVGFNLGLIFNTRIHITGDYILSQELISPPTRLAPFSICGVIPCNLPELSPRDLFPYCLRSFLLAPPFKYSMVFAHGKDNVTMAVWLATPSVCLYNEILPSIARTFASKDRYYDVHFMFTMLSEHWDVVTIAQQHALEATRASALCLCRLPFAADYPASLPTSTFHLVGLTPRTLLPVIFVISSGHTILAQRVSTTLIAGDTFGISGYVPLGFWI
ncbi:hypothetical protein B0H13DRAFT_1896879 [Mycena leptocephala]|nr:hypothetical protein B0H13DRAFT_1896879 [Mycena leptocephala]